MPFRRIHKLVTYLMAAQGLGLLSLSGELTVVGSVVALAALPVSWFIEGERFATRKWVNAWNGVTVAFFILSIVRWMAGEGLPVVAVQFAAFLQVNKLFNRRRQNDHDQIAILSLLHLIASAILYTQISYALVFVLYAVVTPWMLVLGQIRREVEAKYWDRSDRRSIKDLDRVLNSRRIISGSFLMSTALLSIPIYMMTALLFLFFPRIGFGLLASSDPAQRQLTGFSDQVVIGDLEPLFDDPTVVLRAEFPDGPPSQEALAILYWRGSAYDRFDGSQWHRTLGHGPRVDTRGDYYVLSQDPPRGRPSTQGLRRISVYLQPLYPKVIFIPQQTALVTVPAPEPLRVMRQKLRWGPGREVRYTDPGGTGIHYQVLVPGNLASRRTFTPFGTPITEKDEDLEPYLQLPEVSGRLAQLARSFALEHPAHDDRARAVERWFRTDFGYTVTSRRDVPEGVQPVEAFLFDWKEGNCEYFSTAMVLVLRASGIPARNVTGFIGGVWNDVGDYLAVREADAHSWVEVYLPDRGWVLFDPTPPAESVPREPSAFALLMEFMDTVKLSWHKHVIAYDLQHQAELLKKGYRGFSAMRSALHGVRGDMRPRLGPTARRVVILLVVIIAFLVYHATLRMTPERALPLSRRKRKAHRQALDLIGLMDRRLAREGLARPASRPPFTHARRVAADLQDPHTLDEIVLEYNQARFGGNTLSASRFSELRNRVGQIRRKAS